MVAKVTVLGSGAMGTACSILLAQHAGQPVSLWSRDPEQAREMSEIRENRRLLPGVPLPASIEVTADIERAVQGAETLVVAIPTAFLRQALTNIAPFLTSDRPMVSVIKGMENDTTHCAILRGTRCPLRPRLKMRDPAQTDEPRTAAVSQRYLGSSAA
jgi:glycerol-3-phosphate dehydrogenase (NAD(P)+)